MYSAREVTLSMVIVAMAAFQLAILGLVCHIEAVSSIATIVGGIAFGTLLMMVYFSEEAKQEPILTK